MTFFRTYQLFYRTKMFSVVFQFSSPVSLIGLRDFSPGSYSSFQQFLCSAELASKEKGNCNNMTLGARAESSQSRIHVATIIQNFTLVILTSTVTPYQVGLSFKAVVSSYPTHLTIYALDSLLPTQSKGISGYRNYLCFVHLLRNEVYHFSSVTGWRGVELLVGRNQTSFLVKISALSLVLVKVY